MSEALRPPWWEEAGRLEPLVVEISGQEIRSLAEELALLTGLESVVFSVRERSRNVAWGFELHVPEHAVAVAPGRGEAQRERERGWKNVHLGLLRGVRVDGPVQVPGMAEGAEPLWLARFELDGTELLRCGVVAPEDPGDLLRRTGTQLLGRRLETLVWDRIETVWQKRLRDNPEAEADGAETTPGHEEDRNDLELRRRLDHLARETARLLGCDGAGLFTWREARSGYVLDGYFGPEMEERYGSAVDAPQGVSSWWFHAAGDPSLVRSAGGIDGHGEGEPVVLWRRDEAGDPRPNPAAVREFDTRHSETPLAAAIVARLNLEKEPLRPVLMVFGTGGSAWSRWTGRLHEAWRLRDGEHRMELGTIERVHASMLDRFEDELARILAERQDRQRWRVIRTGAAWRVENASPEEEGREILCGIRDLAGAWSGTLWALHEGRRRALALLHPLGDPHGSFKWHVPPETSGLEWILERVKESGRRIGFTRFEYRDRGWQKRFEGDTEWSDAAANTVRWLDEHAVSAAGGEREGSGGTTGPGGERARVPVTIGCAALERGGQRVGALTLAWRHPPLDREELDGLLQPVLDAVGASIGLLVALEEERKHAARERELDNKINTVFQKWLSDVRNGRVKGALARAPESFMTAAAKALSEAADRSLHFCRYERWNHDDVERGGPRDPVVRCLAPVGDTEPIDLDTKLVDDLVKAAADAVEGEVPEPLDIEINTGEEDGTPDESREGSAPILAMAFPAVVGGRISGFLAVEGDPDDLFREVSTWQSVALTLGHTADLIRRNVYRMLDRDVAPQIFRALQRAASSRRKVGVVARELAAGAREVLDARWTAVLMPAVSGRVRSRAVSGAPTGEPVEASRSWGPLELTSSREQNWCCAFDPARPGKGGPRIPGPPSGPTAGLVAPLRSPGGLHGWLLAVAEHSWSLDAARILEALTLRAAPLLAHTLEMDRLFIALASTQHATRSAWQQAHGGLDRLELRLEHLRAVDGDMQSALAMLDEGLDRAGARMASALYLATAGETEASGGRGTAPSFNQLLRDVARMYRIMAEDRDTTIELEVDPGYIPVPGDPLLVQLIVENLVENAIKYARREGRVWARLRRRASHAVLEVGDEGQAFPPETWERYLEPFARIDAGQGGFGVGLWVAADCCRRLGATLEAPVSEEMPEGFHRVVMTVHFILGR